MDINELEQLQRTLAEAVAEYWHAEALEVLTNWGVSIANALDDEDVRDILHSLARNHSLLSDSIWITAKDLLNPNVLAGKLAESSPAFMSVGEWPNDVREWAKAEPRKPGKEREEWAQHGHFIFTRWLAGGSD